MKRIGIAFFLFLFGTLCLAQEIEQNLKDLIYCHSPKTCVDYFPKGLLNAPVCPDSVRGTTADSLGCAFVDNSLKPYVAYPKRYWKQFEEKTLKENEVCGARWAPSIYSMTCANLKGVEAKIEHKRLKCEPDDPKKCGQFIEIPSLDGEKTIRGKFRSFVTKSKTALNDGSPVYASEEEIQIEILTEEGQIVSFEGPSSQVKLNLRYPFDTILCDPGFKK